MLDIGWPELMVIAAVTIVVVGPREIPRVLRTVNGYVRKARSLASEFHSSIEDMAREADLDDLKKKMKETGDEFTGDFEKNVDPTGDVSRSMREVKDSMNKRYGDDKNRAPGNSVTPPAQKTEQKTGQQTEEKSDAASGSSGGGQKTAPPKTATPKTATPKTAPPKTATSKAAAPKSSTPKAPAPKAPAKKAAGKGTGSKKVAAKKATAKKTAAKTTAAKKAPAKKSDAG